MTDILIKHIKRDLLRRNSVGYKYWIFHWERYTDINYMGDIANKYIESMVARQSLPTGLIDPILGVMLEYAEIFGVSLEEIVQPITLAYTEIRKDKIENYTVEYIEEYMDVKQYMTEAKMYY